jgi:hypothetical protein
VTTLFYPHLHFDDSRGVVYDCNIFVILATGIAKLVVSKEGEMLNDKIQNREQIKLFFNTRSSKKCIAKCVF